MSPPQTAAASGASIRDEQARRALPGDDRDAEARDLDVPAGREEDVLGQPEHERVDVLRRHRVLELGNAVESGHSAPLSWSWLHLTAPAVMPRAAAIGIVCSFCDVIT